MPTYQTQDIRNIAMVGHTGGGKTSLVELLLHHAGAIGSPGSVEKGNTLCDFEPEEKEHGHSIMSAIASCDFGGSHVNLIDTPGSPDFMGQTISVLPAAETVAVVVNASSGIEMTTRRMMDRAKERNLCRMIIVNRMDVEDVDLPGLVENLQATFGPECLPINLPASGATQVVDVFDHASGDADFSSVAEAHTAIVDQIVEVDEDLMAKYLEQGEVTGEELHSPFEQALREGHLVPICFTSAKNDTGVKELLDLFARLMPNPTEGNPHPFEIGEGDEAKPLAYEPDANAHVIAHVFKVTTDPFVGKLSVFRIHQGTVTKDSQLYIGNAKKPFKVGHLFKLQGKDHKEIDRGLPGDICAVAKIEDIHFNDVLHDSTDESHVHLHPIEFPMPMSGFAIVAKSRGDESKIAKAMTALASEDPCVVIEHSETHETVMRGLGELHLKILLEKMDHRYHVQVDTHPPKIAYRETINANAKGHYRHKKQTGGAGQFGEVFLRVEPLERGSGFEFVNDIHGGTIPGSLIPAIEKGIRQALKEGAVAGYPIQDIRVSVYDGKFHAVDSKEIAFLTAGKRAFFDAINHAKPTVLEPMVDMEITVPEGNMGDIAGGLAGKRGHIQGTDMIGNAMVRIHAKSPLSELDAYQSELKSVTGGLGSFNMEFSHYEAVPMNVQQKLAAAFSPNHGDD